MKKLVSILICLSVIGIFSCTKDRITGEGPVVDVTRNISGFSGVDLRVSADVYVKKDSVFKVEVSAQQNILDVLETYVSDHKLVVRFSNDVRVRHHDPVRVTVSMPSLDALRISGSGSINTIGAFTGSNMELDISGSGNMDLANLSTGFFDADISGSGNIKVQGGTVTEEKLRISGSGNIDVGNILATKAKTTTSGSGDTRLNATQNLDVTISGSGNVYYKNNPVINTSISGSGKVLHY